MIELQPSGLGIVVNESKATETYSLRGLNFPLDSGMNSNETLEKYFAGRTSLNYSEKIILEKHYSNFYKELQKRMGDEPLSLIEKIFSNWGIFKGK